MYEVDYFLFFFVYRTLYDICQNSIEAKTYNVKLKLMAITQISITLTALGGISLTEFHDETTESVEQDQTARMCRLILLYTLRKMNQSMARKGLMTLFWHEKD